MGRKLLEPVLTTRKARLRLAIGRSYWRQISRCRHLGYRRNKGAGAWRARRYEDGRYRVKGLGHADDLMAADGVDILDYDQALERATAWFQGSSAPQAPQRYTVNDAVEDYHRFLVSEGSPSAESLRSLQRAHLHRPVEVDMPPQDGDSVRLQKEGEWVTWSSGLKRRRTWGVRRPLAAIEVRQLESQMIRDWRHSIVQDGRAWVTSNRMLGALKSALNLAFQQKEELVPSDLAWRRVTARRVPRKKIVWYHVEEARRIIQACEPDFRLIAFGSLITGMRWGECCRLNVGDFEPIPGQPLLRIHVSKNGYSRQVFLDRQGFNFFTHLSRDRSPDEPMFLASIATGAAFAYHANRGWANVQAKQRIQKHFGDYRTEPTSSLPASVLQELLSLTGLLRDDASSESYRRWRTHAQKRRFERAVREANVQRPKQGFHDLRRTYASLLVSSGMSLKAVADQLGHRDTRMVETHYGELARSVRAVAVQKRMPDLDLDSAFPSNTEPLDIPPHPLAASDASSSALATRGLMDTVSDVYVSH